MSSEFIPWSTIYEVGVPLVDKQHVGLVKMINDFYVVIKAAHKREEVFFLLNSLIRYAEEHFRDEEALMAAGRYPELSKHKIEHERLILKVFDLAASYERRETEIDDDVMAFLKEWLIDHILKEDKKLEMFFRQRGLPEGW